MSFTIFSQSDRPTVTIAIPTFNEASYIEQTILYLLNTTYPHVIELFVADGGSTDGTQEIVRQLSQKDVRIKLLHNPLKVQSAALNLILKHASGDVYLRADAHSDYAPDYVERCVEALLESQALNVGGAQRFAAKTAFQAGIALASKSFLGSGGARYRSPLYSGYADTVYLGCFWRQPLQTLSGYRVEATANEDFELNLRLKDYYHSLTQDDNSTELNSTSASGNKAIYISSKICTWYFPRASLKLLWKQYFTYGCGRYMTTINHRQYVSWRGNLPFLALSGGFVILLLIDFFSPSLGLLATELLPILLLIPLLEGLRVTWQFRNRFRSEIWRGDLQNQPSFLTCWIFCSISLLMIPIAHALGFGYQLFRHQVLKRTEI